VIASNQETDDDLAEPLLRSEEDEVGEQLSAGLSRIMDHGEPVVGGGESSNSNSMSNSMLLSSGPMSNAGVRRAVFFILQLRTAADILPTILQVIVTSGKLSGVVFLGVYAIFIALWFPFWLLSFLISEWGVYSLAILVVFLAGRAIIRMIAFPGSSQRVASEIENEFSKYSCRMLLSSSNSIIDFSTALLETGKGGGEEPSGNQNPSFAYYEIHSLWKRAKSYRDRVLAVYAEVLIYIFKSRDEAMGNNSQSDITKYGNNRLTGDIGNLMGLTVSILL
jgi:hypothetical protein